MNRLFKIAKELGGIARDRVELKYALSDTTDNIAAREIALIPEGGWPGSNDTARKTAERMAKSADTDLNYWLMVAKNQQHDLDNLEARRDALIAERDAWQWTIRDAEVTAIGPTLSVFARMKLYDEGQWMASQRAEGAETDELDLLTQTPDNDPPF